MRFGCLGCLALALILVGMVGLGWVGLQALREPEFQAPPPAPGDGARAQQKLYELVRRRSARRLAAAEPIVLTQGELNAFLSRHLAEVAETPFTDIRLRLAGAGAVELRARLPLAHLLIESPLSGLAGAIPATWLERPVWLRLRAGVRIEPGTTRRERRYLRLDVRQFAVGRQRLPAVLLRMLLDPRALRVLRWPLPDAIEAITIETDRVVIRRASWPRRTGPGGHR